MSSPPPASPPMVWPPSNPSGTVIPFPLPWGQTGCCPPGGLDALMKCYCDIQQASAFIGQIMLDQINNNPAIIAAIIAGIENSGSSLPTVGVTNGAAAQPGQVGEFVAFSQSVAYPTTSQNVPVTMGVLPPGDWDIWAFGNTSTLVSDFAFVLNPVPAGVSNDLETLIVPFTAAEALELVSTTAQALISVPTLFVFQVGTNGVGAGSSAGTATITFNARRRR